MKNPYSTPKFISSSQQRLGKTNADKSLFSTNLFAWDVFSRVETGELAGYDSSDDFVNAVLQAGQGVAGDVLFNISLRPSTTLTSWRLKVRRNTGTENYSQQEDDFAKLFYSKEIYEFIIDDELDFNNKLIFFSFKSIYNLRILDELLDPIKDTDFYITDSYKTITKADGTFDYGILRIKKLNPVTKRGSVLAQDSGTLINIYTRFTFYRISIQPKNVKRIRRTFYGKAVLYAYFAYGENQVVPLPYTITDNSTEWYENLFPFRLTGQAVSVLPLWSQEWKYWYDAIGQGNNNLSAGILKINKVDGARLDEHLDSREFQPAGWLEISGNNGDSFDKAAPSIWEGAPPAYNGRYYDVYTSIQIDFTIGNFEIDKLMETASEAVDYILPNGYDLFGLRRRNSSSDDGANAIPRKQGTNGYWYSLKNELIYFFDFMTDEALFALAFKEFGSFYSQILWKNDVKAQYGDGSIEDYNPYYEKTTKFGSELRKTNLANLLQRKLNWIGTSWSELPEGIIVENTLDTNGNTWEYDSQKLNGVIGLFPFDIEQTWDMCSGTGFEKQIANTTTKSQDLGLFGNGHYNYRYLLASQYRLIFLPYEIFYEADEGNSKYVIEIELEEQAKLLSREDLYMLGGNKIDVEYFQNSYEDSLINGDISCTIDLDIDNDGESLISFELPVQTYPAPNNQGNPRQIYQAIIYGATG